jgi:PAS domain S-box-containing protein
MHHTLEGAAAKLVGDHAHTLFDVGVVGLAIVSTRDEFLAVNPEFCRITTWSPSQLVRKRWQDITHPSDVEPDAENIERVADGKMSGYQMRKRYIGSRDEVIPVWLSVTAIFEHDDHAPGGRRIACYFVQITKDVGPSSSMLNSEHMIAGSELKAIKMLSWLRKHWPIVLWMFTGVVAAIGYVAEKLK